jgi:hypothetical protein
MVRIAIIRFTQGTHPLLFTTLGRRTAVTRSAAALTGRCSSQANVPGNEVRRTDQPAIGPNEMLSLWGKFQSKRSMRDQQRGTSSASVVE